ncbi:GSCOCG00007265001-RA-CDS, partial [Cotesia congregata]
LLYYVFQLKKKFYKIKIQIQFLTDGYKTPPSNCSRALINARVFEFVGYNR